MDQMTTEEIEAELNRLGCAEQFGSRTDELEAELRVRFGVVERAEDVVNSDISLTATDAGLTPP